MLQAHMSTDHFKFESNTMTSYYGPYINLTEDFCKLYKDGQVVDLKPNINPDQDYIKDKWIDLDDFDKPEVTDPDFTALEIERFN